jgi:branched-chain amino acid transport system permease protein
VTVVAVVLIVNAPGWLSRYQIDILFTVFTLIGLAQAWNIIGGLGGQFSLAHHAFVGVGSYTTALLLLHTGVPTLVAVLASSALSAALAALVSFPLFRLRGVYFAIGSLAVALAAQAWMINWTWAGATKGLNLPTDPIPAPFDLYRLAGIVAVLATLSVYLIARSQFGLRLMAVRDHEDAAVGLGVRGFTVKAAALSYSAFLAGLVGALIAFQQISIEPVSAFGLGFTINMVIMVTIGGIGTTAGPVLGVFLVYYCIQRPLESSANLSTILTGVLLILVIRFAPGGLWGVLQAAAGRGWTWARRRRDGVAAGGLAKGTP